MSSLTRLIVAALAAAAIAAPAASGSGPLDSWQQNLKARAYFEQVTDPWALNLFARQSHRDGQYTAAFSSRPVATVAGSGFDWADFGIGAATLLAVVLLAVGAVAAIRRTRRQVAAT